MLREAVYTPGEAPGSAVGGAHAQLALRPNGDEEPADPARSRHRGFAVGAAPVFVVLMIGVFVLSFVATARPGQPDWSTLLRGAKKVPQGLPDRVAAVFVDASDGDADPRRMQNPLSSVDAPLPHMVRWGMTTQDSPDEEPQKSQRFTLLKHADGRISLKYASDMHMDVAENVTSVIGAVRGDGQLMRLAIQESGKFKLIYNFDDTISLQHSSGGCLTVGHNGSLSLADCEAEDGTGAIFIPVIILDEGAVAFKSLRGGYLTVVEGWLQGYMPSVLVVNETVARNSPSECAKFYALSQPDGQVALRTGRATFLTVSSDRTLTADGVEVGKEQLFSELESVDGSVSLVPASGGSRYLEVRGNGRVAATGTSGGGVGSLTVMSNADGSVSLKSGGKFLCAAERSVKVLTCETRKSWEESWPMMGVNTTMTIQNVCFNKTWYGFKTKVDAYLSHVKEMAREGQPEQLVVLVDNSDMAFGGCTYEDLLRRYDRISSLVKVPVIAGADNKLFPTTDWPYHTLDERRKKIMKAFDMAGDEFCEYADCDQFSYKYANSGFLMGPPKDLEKLLSCMLENGWGDFGKTGYDDQQGLHACLFNDPNLVALDYTGTLSQQLIFFDDNVLYKKDHKVYNKVAGGVPQCFVHGNGDTMKTWWPKLFPGMNKTEDYGKAFQV